MNELQNLQSRVDAMLLVPHARPPAQAAASTKHAAHATAEQVVAAPPASFSPFDPVQAQRANLLARRFVQLANAAEGTASLQAVLDEADKARATENPELV